MLSPKLILLACLAFTPAAFSQPGLLFGLIDANGNSAPLAPGGNITFSPTSVGGVSSVTVTIANQGADSVSLNGVSVTGDGFQLAGVPFPGATLLAGASASFTIRFTPAQIGPASGTVRVALAQGAVTFTLAGTGVGPAFSYRLQRGSAVTPLLPSQTIAFPDTSLSQQSVVTVQVLNTGTANGQIPDIAILGAGYRLADLPFLPATVPPNGGFSFGLVFAPTQPGQAPGRLKIGSDTFTVTGNALGASLVFSYTTAGTPVVVQNNSAVVFSPTAIGSTSGTSFSISNQGTAPAVITSIGVAGSNAVFSVTNLPPLPLTLAPGASAAFGVAFAPSSVGVVTASLMVDAQSFILTGAGTGNSPGPLPGYKFTGASGVQAPRTQPAIGLTLNAPYALPLSGTLTVGFTSDVFSDDPAIQFATGSRTVSFSIPPNTTSAVFSNGSTQIQLATGTVAGAITITPSFTATGGVSVTPDSPLALKMTVAQTAPVLLTAQVEAKTATGFTLALTGLSTGRNLTKIDFQFTLVTGASVTVPNITLNVEQMFTVWYQGAGSQGFGSLFTVSVPFNLAGQLAGYPNLVDSIQSVAVTLTNHQGTSNAQAVQVK